MERIPGCGLGLHLHAPVQSHSLAISTIINTLDFVRPPPGCPSTSRTSSCLSVPFFRQPSSPSPHPLRLLFSAASDRAHQEGAFCHNHASLDLWKTYGPWNYIQLCTHQTLSLSPVYMFCFSSVSGIVFCGCVVCCSVHLDYPLDLLNITILPSSSS